MRPGFATKIRGRNHQVRLMQWPLAPAIYEVRGWGVKPNRRGQAGSSSRDSGFDAEPVIGPRFARTRWHRPGVTVKALSALLAGAGGVGLQRADAFGERAAA